VGDGLRHWAAVTPERTALTSADEVVTYADLLARVRIRGRAARAALQQSPDDAFLPVLVDRSVEACISVLACDVARVPFFPVDAAAPAAALAAVIDRAGEPTSVLAHPGLAHIDLPPGVAAVTDHATGRPDDPWRRGADDHLGLVVFTSGSTGTPKGVAFDWRTRDARWRRRLDEPRRHPERARTLAVLPFDSAWGIDVAASVAVGYSVHVADVTRLHPAEVLALLADQRATHLDAPPQLLRLIGRVPSAAAERLPSMEFVRVGSEPLRFEFLDGLRATVPSDTVIEHAYGATESGWAFSHRFALADAPEHGAAPLGRPLEEGCVHLAPLADGDEPLSEVVVSGPISAGYLGDPEQTGARFTADDTGRRWWRSGDVVSVDEQGLVWHRGRLDDIVKVRGKLVSPSQVVAVLMAVPGIRHAVVLPCEQDHNVRLVAHVELDPDAAVTLPEVKQALSRELPAHLVPSAVMRHRALPTGVRGKVDRARLMEGPFEPW
jgi:acyl-CoA synthetase (AMP-forming)/AMP-acid ligase II